MKNITALFRRIFTGKSGRRSRSEKVYLVDGASLMGRHGDRSLASPREVSAWIQRLDRFCRTERVRMRAFFLSEPLRKAPDGVEMGGLEVYYAARPEDLTEIVARQIRELQRTRCQVTVITSNAVLEQRAQSLGGAVLRATTFCKALDLSRSGMPDGRPPREDGDRGRREDRGGHRRRRRSSGGSGGEMPRTGRPPEPAEPALSPPPTAAGTAEPPPNSARGAGATGGGTAPSPSDDIRKLIDLVE